jgi:hypothetical protein
MQIAGPSDGLEQAACDPERFNPHGVALFFDSITVTFDWTFIRK